MMGAKTVGVLRQRAPRLLVGAAALSAYGDGFFVVASSGLLLELGGPPALTVAATITYLGAMASSPLAGQLADRWPRQKIMVAADLVRAACMGALALFVALGFATLPLVFGLCCACTVAGTVFRAARGGLMPVTVRAEELYALNAVDGALGQSAWIFGPALCAGAILLGADRSALFCIDALTFLISAALLLRLPSTDTAKASSDALQPEQHWLGGARFLAQTRALWWSVALVFFNHAAAGAMFVVVPALASALLADVGIGYAESALGVGLVVGTLAGGALGAKAPRVTAMVGVGLFGATLALAGLVSTFGLLAGIACAMGFSACLADSPLTTRVQLLTPDALRGRVSSVIDAVGCVGLLCGAATFGLLSPRVGFDLAGLAIGGTVAVGALMCFLLSMQPPESSLSSGGSRT